MIVIKPQRRCANKLISYVCTLLYFLTGVSFIYILIQLIFFLTSNEFNSKTFLISMLSLIVMILILLIFNYSFSWFISASINKDKNGRIIYKVKDVIDVLGKDETYYKINSCTKMKKKGTNLVLYGDIEKTEPMSKTKNIKKVKILQANNDVITFISSSFSL